MTREEAIEVIKLAMAQVEWDYPMDYAAAFDMAIKALEQEPTTKNDLGVDCISKKNALRVANNEYLRGFHNALCKALNETYSIHCDEGHFRVIQEETLVGLGMSMESALGSDAESFMNTLPSVTPQEPFKPMVEIDLYSVIKQKYIEREVLDKIITEVEIWRKDDTNWSDIRLMNIEDIIDKYKAETEAE